MPWSYEVLEAIHEARQSGQKIILATGADQLIADKVASHLGCFDLALGSDSKTNLIGPAKRDALQRICGTDGFDYIGNEVKDSAVWSSAQTALAVKKADSEALAQRMRIKGIELKFLEPKASNAPPPPPRGEVWPLGQKYTGVRPDACRSQFHRPRKMGRRPHRLSLLLAVLSRRVFF